MNSKKTLHLPNGSTASVKPIFGGVAFSCDGLMGPWASVPRGWTVMINTEKQPEGDEGRGDPTDSLSPASPCSRLTNSGTQLTSADPEPLGRFVEPTLNHDSLFISSMTSPSERDYQPAASQTRAIALMLWITFWWYFHLEDPNTHPWGTDSRSCPPETRTCAGEDWRLYMRQEGVFNGAHILQKLERMGLISSLDSTVGLDGGRCRKPAGWDAMFVSQKSFWQIDPKVFLFVLRPNTANGAANMTDCGCESHPGFTAAMGDNASHGPFCSASFLPTYFPPPPPQYILTKGIRHPIRQKPPRQGEVMYSRYIPSLDQTLSFRVPDIEGDIDVLHRWMNSPRVRNAWGVSGPHSAQEKFLQARLCDRHLFPALGCWDNKPFGYFEIYWMKEDCLGRRLHVPPDNFEHGIRCLIGEDNCSGLHRGQVWISSLVHYCLLTDFRTQSVVANPQVGNLNYQKILSASGFKEEGEVTLGRTECIVMKVKREDWQAPTL